MKIAPLSLLAVAISIFVAVMFLPMQADSKEDIENTCSKIHWSVWNMTSEDGKDECNASDVKSRGKRSLPDEPSPQSQILNQSETEIESVSVIVYYNKQDNETEIKKKLSDLGNITDDDVYLGEGSESAVGMEIPRLKLKNITKINDVIRIEPNYEFRALLQQSRPMIGADRAIMEMVGETNITGKGIGVCVLDTGLDYTHKDFGGCKHPKGRPIGKGDINNRTEWKCERVVGGRDFVNKDNNPFDDGGHGTEVTGIIAANGGIVGVAPNVNIIPIKVLDSKGGGESSRIISGINWCSNRADTLNISVISMSLGMGDGFSGYCDYHDIGTSRAVNRSYDKGISLVASSGNDGNVTHMKSPACLRNTISVGASYDKDRLQFNEGDIILSYKRGEIVSIEICKDRVGPNIIACFSNRNRILDLLAPGAMMNATKKGGGYSDGGKIRRGRLKMSYGTSFAAPHVSGALALMIHKSKMVGIDATPEFLLDILKTTGRNITDVTTHRPRWGIIDENHRSNLTFPRIDIMAALSKIIRDDPFIKVSKVSEIAESELGTATVISAFWKSNVNLEKAILSTNETGSFVNYTGGIYSSPVSFVSGKSGWSNFSWSNISVPNGMTVSWVIYANDTEGKENVTTLSSFTIRDTTGPTHSNFSQSGGNYEKDRSYTFNSTTTEFTRVDTVLFEWNGTENVTAAQREKINSTFSTYTAGRSDLAAGKYTFRWISNDTLGNTETSPIQNFDLGKGATSISMTLNGSQEKVTYGRDDTISIKALINVTHAKLPILLFKSFNDGPTKKMSENNSILEYSAKAADFEVGAYDLFAFSLGNENYTKSDASLEMIIREAYRNASLNIKKEIPTKMDAADTNVTLGFFMNDAILEENINVTVGTDNPVSKAPPNVGIGKFIRINISEPVENSINYMVLRYQYTKSEIPRTVDENSLRIYRWNGLVWERFDGDFVGGVDTSKKIIFANLSSFSDFTITGRITKPTLSLTGLPTVTTLAGDGTAGFANGLGTAAKFDNPRGIAADSSGKIYVADTLNHIIRKITPSGIVTTLAGTKGSAGSADGIGTAAKFDRSSGITIDGSGNLYIVDTGNHIIRKIASDGMVTTLAGTKGSAGSADGIGTAAKFNKPIGMAADSSGNLYVVDTGNHIIRKIASDGMVSTIAGDGTIGFANGLGTAAKFNYSWGITIDNSGNLYVTDSGNHIIRKIASDGMVTTLAGTKGSAGSADGIGTAAKFNKPRGIVADSSGNLYVTDSGNHTIRKITPDGTVSTIAGSGTRGFANGLGIAAKFSYPWGITIDSSGNLYVADTDNHIIRKMSQHPEKLELNRTTRQLTIKFSKNISISEADPAKLHIREAYFPSGGITLSSGELTTKSNSDTLQFTLNPANKVTIAALTTPQLDIDSSAVTDTVGNKINAAFDYLITMSGAFPVAPDVKPQPSSGGGGGGSSGGGGGGGGSSGGGGGGGGSSGGGSSATEILPTSTTKDITDTPKSDTTKTTDIPEIKNDEMPVVGGTENAPAEKPSDQAIPVYIITAVVITIAVVVIYKRKR